MNDLSTMNKIMEYMALGKPIVQFDLKEGKVTAQDASDLCSRQRRRRLRRQDRRMLADPARRAAMGAAGFTRVRDQLAWEYERPKLVAAYASLGLMLKKHERRAVQVARTSASGPCPWPRCSTGSASATRNGPTRGGP